LSGSRRATGNGQQPTASNQQPTVNGQRPTANGQQPTANGQQPTANGQRATANGQQPTGNGQQPKASNHRATGYGQQPTGNGQQPTGNSQQPTGNSQQPTANKPTTNGQWAFVARDGIRFAPLVPPVEFHALSPLRGDKGLDRRRLSTRFVRRGRAGDWLGTRWRRVWNALRCRGVAKEAIFLKECFFEKIML
jgi:hypothetical protein